MSEAQGGNMEAIAIVGMAGCYPGASNLAQFWDNLCEGKESISHFTDEEHEIPIWASADTPWIKSKGVLENPELFDAAFFGYTPEEAKAMDPQHRIFLERGWEAIEQAGYDVDSYEGSIGVFAGMSANTYVLASMHARGGSALFTDKDFLATRLSYRLNLRGPSVTVQSACSTSLVAVCLAAQSLLNYQCDMAVAGGASVWVPTKSGYPYQTGWPMSPDGHTRAFDAMGAGFVPGSGVGAVLLKRLSEAVEDGDFIWAVIRGFAVNNDGSGKIGYSAPSIGGQAEVITLAQEFAGIDPETIGYVEAHGTGTELGDPIEIAALTEAFRRRTGKSGYCAIGSVKTNIGHLDAAAGIASLQKAVLAVQNAKIPPSLNFEKPNPKIDFNDSPFFVNTVLRDWKTTEGPRRAGVNSFGIGGTNSHVVLEEAPASRSSGPRRQWQLLPLSARTQEALDESSVNLAGWLDRNPAVNLADAAFTLQAGRKGFQHRRIAVCRSPAEAAEAFRSAPGPEMSAVAAEGQRQIVFMFPGQGAQYAQMTRELYETEAAFRRVVDDCCKILEPEIGLDLRTIIYPDAADAEAEQRLMQTSFAQPSLFVVEYALAKLWEEWGVRPAAVIGHSVGEFVAACLAGVLNLDDALRLVNRRAALMNKVPAGAMLAVPVAEQDLQKWLSGDLVLAAVNAPALSVISGPADQIDDLALRLGAAKVAAIRLKTSHAFHSAMLDPILGEFEAYAAGIEMRAPVVPYISNVTGDWMDASRPPAPSYWAQHLRRPVRFSKGIKTLLERDAVFLEVGPGRTLGGLAASHPGCGSDRVISSLGQPRQGASETGALLKAAGRLWLSGARIDWAGLHAPDSRRRIVLPTYPFQRQRYWALDEIGDFGPAIGPVQARGKSREADRFYIPSWKRVPVQAPVDERGLPSTWVIFEDQAGMAAALAERLGQSGKPVVRVRPAATFAETGAGEYQINPFDKEHYRMLTEQLSDGQGPLTIVHMWGVGGAVDEGRSGRVGFYSLVYLAQALANAGINSPVKIAVVTDGAHLVLGDEKVNAEKSLIQGPCRVLPQEFSNLTCCQIDVARPHSPQAAAAQVQQLVGEIEGRWGELVVAFRRGQRWVQTYEPVSLPPSRTPETRRLHRGGCYLITGGLGGIGSVLSRWLGEVAGARLVLTARTAMPPRESWDEWLAAHPDDDQTSRKIKSVREIEQAGAEVLVLQADVTDEAQMKRVVQAANEAFGPINGAIHAAGVPGGGIVQLKTMEVGDAVLAPKVDGSIVLNRVLAGQPLDFLALCSSMSAIIGGFGQVDYCAANAFMDALAWENRASGRPYTVSMNWNAWREVGMAVETQVPDAMRELRDQFVLTDSLSNQEGIEAFRRILDGYDEPQVAIVLTDLPEYLKRRQEPPEDIAARVGPRPAMQPRPELQTPYSEPITETEKAVSAIWQEIFGFEKIGRHDDFFELGGHSLMAVQLLRPLQEGFETNLTLPALFEHSTVEALSQYIDQTVWARGGAPPDRAPQTDEREEITL